MSTSARIRHRAVPVPTSPEVERDRADTRPADAPSTAPYPRTEPTAATSPATAAVRLR
ncbi:hypothetical protein [Occultella glacieicola]|uniref:hypothetical protein n=1 Tax=Occultella glacieicola TaxID=2518684 RepID=UPI001404C56D|nr:hypothetical protein [Occultella glacieicola]